MEQFKQNFSNVQPQLVSIVLVTLILVTLSVIIFKKIQKIKPDEVPSGIAFVAEQYVRGVDNLFKSVAGNKLSPMAPYIFSLLSFMVLGNLIGLIGFEQPNTSYSVPLILGLFGWTGTLVVGVMYQKLRYFRKYLINPTDIFSQIAPLISITFRIFGNTIGGATILFLIYHLIGKAWGHVPVLGEVNLLASLLAPPFHVYFDLFDGVIQAYVFTLLTLMYWVLETTDAHSSSKEDTTQEKIVVAKNEKVNMKKKLA